MVQAAKNKHDVKPFKYIRKFNFSSIYITLSIYKVLIPTDKANKKDPFILLTFTAALHPQSYKVSSCGWKWPRFSWFSTSLVPDPAPKFPAFSAISKALFRFWSKSSHLGGKNHKIRHLQSQINWLSKELPINFLSID